MDLASCSILSQMTKLGNAEYMKDFGLEIKGMVKDMRNTAMEMSTLATSLKVVHKAEAREYGRKLMKSTKENGIKACAMEKDSGPLITRHKTKCTGDSFATTISKDMAS